MVPRTHTWHNHDPGNEKKESMFQVGSIWGFSRSW
jgi:hypothetical protein